MDWPFSKLFTKKRALIVDPSLADEAGHHLNVASAIAASLGEAGYAVRTLAFRDFATRDHPQLSAKPIFLNRCYDSVWSVLERPARFDALATKFASELEHTLAGSRETTVVFPTVTFMDFPGIAEWIAAHPKTEELKVFFWIVFGPEFMVRSDDQVPMVREWYREGFEQMERATEFGAKIYPIVETPGLHKEWQALTTLPIATIRLPSMVHFLNEAANASSSGRVVVGYGGDARTGKGFELLPEIVTQTLADADNVEFDIRVAVEDRGLYGEALAALQAAGPRVSLKVGSLPPTRFQEFLASCDIILLPYDPEIYVLRGSSISDEAEALGLPQVAPGGVSFSHKAISGGAARAFTDYNAGDVSQALVEAIDNLASLRAAAAAMRSEVTNQNEQFMALVEQN